MIGRGPAREHARGDCRGRGGADGVRRPALVHDCANLAASSRSLRIRIRRGPRAGRDGSRLPPRPSDGADAKAGYRQGVAKGTATVTPGPASHRSRLDCQIFQASTR